MRTFLITLGLLPALLTAACTSDSGSTGSRGDTASASGASQQSSEPSGGNGCQYVTTDAVSKLVGVKVTAKPIAPAPPYNAPSCLYESSAVPVRQITVVVYTKKQLDAANGQTAESFLAAVKASLDKPTPLPGLGDEAIASGATVYARKSGAIVYVTAGLGGTSQTAVNSTRKVAEKVLAQL